MRIALRRACISITFLLAFLSGPIGSELSFRNKKSLVLQASPGEIADLGQHILVGYRNPREILTLIDHRAIAGVFIGARNVAGKSAAAIEAEIRLLQARQAENGGPPLIIASDQEGGIVSRLSPPLTLQPALAEVVAEQGEGSSLSTRVSSYASLQARELAGIGINVNFGPVVDLAGRNDSFPEDEYSLLSLRGISTVPALTTEVAMVYCQSLSALGVVPTLKHFPGLGKLRVDTHRYLGALQGSVAELEQDAWLPFKEISAKVPVFIMLGHVKVPAVDARYPASSSRKIIEGILRKRWGYTGILVTDDFSMGPVFFAKGGPGAAALRSLNAGVDLLLIGQRSEQIYPVLAALLTAKREGTLSHAALEKSSLRLSRLMERLHAAALMHRA